MSRVINPSCETCKHCHPIVNNTLVVDYMRDKVFYCSYLMNLYCENEPCSSGYEKRRAEL